MLHTGMLLYAPETTMMIGEHQPVLRHYHARTETAEAHHCILQRSFARAVQFLRLKLKPHLFQGAGGLFVQITQHPHALVGHRDYAYQ